MSTWWENVERELVLPGDQSNLLVDGYLLTIIITPISRLRSTLRIYVDGRFSYQWLHGDDDESREMRRRFLRATRHRTVVGKMRDEMKAERENRRCPPHLRRYIDAQLSRHLTMHRADWTSMKSLRRHLVRNNQSIEHVSQEQAQQLREERSREASAA